ncbi:hypothetical protein [Chryseobacterium carnipullorum]|uniref:hypothetical protein n=1 Tax=Chryseobacterium carnipullorum TaxID=1124835 RepID=UPI000E84006B|nr:hypothetical protein [Chryseobacterium carnipullorum]HBV14940.1 hypothetical protein [Chryseobacterium carnipullorum]
MSRKIFKVTLTASNGVLKNLIHDIIHKKDLIKFEKRFSANIAETEINITEKKGFDLCSEDWDNLLIYLDNETENLIFSQSIEYA